MTGTATMKVGQFGRPTLSKDGRTITVHIPLTLRHQGGRKQGNSPDAKVPYAAPFGFHADMSGGPSSEFAGSSCPPVDRLPHIAARQSTLPTLVAMLFRLWRCRCRGAATGRCRRHWRLDAFVSDFTARPGKIIGATGRRRQRLAFDQDPRR